MGRDARVENHHEGSSMNRSISLVLLAGGIVLLILGINAYDSTSSDISRFFTGAATDKSTWMLLGGAVVTILGIVGLSRASKKA
jgi:uncharacterized membrane protein YidH (DUF202 family)